MEKISLKSQYQGFKNQPKLVSISLSGLICYAKSEMKQILYLRRNLKSLTRNYGGPFWLWYEAKKLNYKIKSIIMCSFWSYIHINIWGLNEEFGKFSYLVNFLDGFQNDSVNIDGRSFWSLFNFQSFHNFKSRFNDAMEHVLPKHDYYFCYSYKKSYVA